MIDEHLEARSVLDGAYCPVTWDPVEGRWLRGPITVFGEEQPDGPSGGEDPMLREAAE
jgi:hypothetical protein